ncbi:hypothetical protein M0Q28_01030 [Patescibacteria group bacterium]|jgi:hypothetical protein|nr:hypothetical protein [Patescibacteria group bacterium]
MRHRTFNDICQSVKLGLADDDEFKWILDRLQERAIVFAQDEEEGIRPVRTPDRRTERALVIVLLRERAVTGRDDSSVVYNDDMETMHDGPVSAIFVADRDCEPFWFGLKASVEVLLYERSFDYSELKAEIAQTLAELAPRAPLIRPALARIRKESHKRLSDHAHATKDMYQRLVYRALNRRLEGRLEALIPKIRDRRAVFAAQKHFLQQVALDLYLLTKEAFPEPSSVEEEAARSVLIAVASSHAVRRAIRIDTRLS